MAKPFSKLAESVARDRERAAAEKPMEGLGDEGAYPIDWSGAEPAGTNLHWDEGGVKFKQAEQVARDQRSSSESTEGKRAQAGGGGMAGSSPKASAYKRPPTAKELADWADAELAKQRAKNEAIDRSQPTARDPHDTWLDEYMAKQRK